MIVIGFDGSEPAAAALRWAAAEALIRQTGLRVLLAWRIAEMISVSMADHGYDGYVPPLPELAALAQNRLEEGVATSLHGENRSNVECAAVQDHPSAALVKASADADLLVVGSRGHGPIAGTALGSVSLACVHQAECPVVVVRR